MDDVKIGSIEKWDDVINVLDDIVLVIDKDLEIKKINEKGLSFLNKSREDVIGKKCHYVFHSCKDPVCFCQNIKYRQSKKTVLYEFHHKELDRWFSVKSSPIYNENKEPEYFVEIISDITEKKRDEWIVSEHENKYRDLIDFSPIGIYKVNREGDFILVNDRMASLFGYQKDELYKLNIRDIYFDQAEREKLIAKYDINPRPFCHNVNVKLKHKTGQAIWVLMTARAIKNKDGNTVIYDGFIIDNHQQVKTREILLDNELKFRTLLENMPGGLLLIDDNYRIREVNDVTCRITGFSREELVGQLCDIVCPKGSASKMCPIWEENNDGFQGMDTSIKCQSGYKNPILKNAQRLNLKGERFILEVYQDISKLKETENALIEAKNDAEESNRLKSAFLANMSHEIRTPMNSIMGFVDLLGEQGLSIKDKERYLNIIDESNKRLLDTINDIIEISKIESGEMSLKVEEVRIAESMDSLVRAFEVEANKKGLKILKTFEGIGKDIILETDRFKLEAIMTNLMKNAIKFTNEGIIEIGCIYGDNYVELFVSDTGIGISKADLNNIFERFYQVDVSYSKKYQGSGLGLSISKAYADMIGGTIKIESKPGEGSKFMLLLNKQKY